MQYAKAHGDSTPSTQHSPVQKTVNSQQNAAEPIPMPVTAATPDATPSEPKDPLVLRTPQELMPVKEASKGRDVPLVSSRVITIKLEADGGLPIGTAWIYLFDHDDDGKPINKARRVLKFTNRPLARIICGPDELRYFFKEVDYFPEKGTREISQQFVAEIKALLDKKQAIVRTPKNDKPKTRPVAKQNDQVPVKPAKAPLPVEKPQQVVVPQPAHGPMKQVNRAVNGTTYEGVVVSAGMTQKNGQGNSSYSTFCLTLNDGHKETPLNGTEIQRQVKDLGIAIGDRIKVVSMGRQSVVVPGQEAPGWKNLFQITRLGVHG